ncbi:uncharacterized protein LOC126336202 [Schistocerca gregaria]|uniref:uncharacterized protein LOC126336202 n=1 Tax=Schistocerca gregaria TaxID=7010 RepID=UPI00211E4ACE|nr:uncharacterized protein LOC126336202 [Schistocerca gregaria]
MKFWAVTCVLVALAAACSISAASAPPRRPSLTVSNAILRSLARLPRAEAVRRFRNLVLGHQRNAIDDAIIQLLEELRSIIPEPVSISHVDVDLQSSILELTGAFDNVTINGLTSYVINSVNNDLDNLQANFSVGIPEINFAGQYNLEGSAGSIVGLYGEGPFTLLVQDFQTSGTVHIGTADGSSNSAVSITAMEVSFSVAVFRVNFENLNGGGLVGDLLNELISDLAPEFIALNQEQLGDLVEQIVRDLVNPYLGTCTLQELLDFLGYEGRRMRRADSTCILYQLP